jgi:DNA-binding Xre family transcriptional regulator
MAFHVSSFGLLVKHMPKLTIEALGRKLLDRRGHRGVREVAKEIGISPATLSRIERGYVPDLETFGKVCRWLQVNPGDVLGIPTKPSVARLTAAVHFRKDQTLNPETAHALARLILAAQRAIIMSEQGE